MAAVDSHDCSWEASGCVRRSFLVCFWYDLSAVSKIAWKRDSEEAEVVACDEDMARAWECHGGELRGIVDRNYEHWAKGKHRLMAKFPIEGVGERL